MDTQPQQPTLEEVLAALEVALQENARLQNIINAQPAPIDPIMFDEDDFETFVTSKLKTVSLIDLQYEVLSFFVRPLSKLGFKLAGNTSVDANGDKGRTSQNGISHKAQFVLNDDKALKHVDPRVRNWLASTGSQRIAWGDTSWIDADSVASQANGTDKFFG